MKGKMSGASMHLAKGRDKWNKVGTKCPACNSYDSPRGGVLKKRRGKNGYFLGCSRYPECKFTDTY